MGGAELHEMHGKTNDTHIPRSFGCVPVCRDALFLLGEPMIDDSGLNTPQGTKLPINGSLTPPQAC